MKKIIVNQEACIGCGACVAVDEEHFTFNDEGLSTVKSNDNLTTEELANAIECCPTCAISLNDSDCSCSDCECDECDCEEECSCNECNCTNENNCGCHCFEE